MAGKTDNLVPSEFFEIIVANPNQRKPLKWSDYLDNLNQFNLLVYNFQTLKLWITRFACRRSFNFVAYLYLFADNRLLFLVPRWRHLPTQVFCWNLTSWPGRTEMGRGRRTPSPRSGTPWTTFGPDSGRGGGRRPQLLNISNVPPQAKFLCLIVY